MATLKCCIYRCLELEIEEVFSFLLKHEQTADAIWNFFVHLAKEVYVLDLLQPSQVSVNSPLSKMQNFVSWSISTT